MTARVIYVVGTSRSGSTIFGNCLATLENVFVADELRFLPMVLETGRCGCGRLLVECDVWVPILESLRAHVLPRRVRGAPRLRDVPLTLVRPRQRSRRNATEALQTVYDEISARTGSIAIVDTSGAPGEASLLAASSRNLIVHLVRDPRAVVHSRLYRTRAKIPNRNGFVFLILNWILVNVAAEMIRLRAGKRHLRIRYEDFVKNPESVLRTLAEILGTKLTSRIEGCRIEVSANHSAAGSYTRFQHGVVELRDEGRWHGELSKRQRLAITALTWPLLFRYGYPVRPRPEPVGGPGSPSPGPAG